MAWRGCVMKWAKTEFLRSTNTTSRSTRLNPQNQQRCGFRREAKRLETKKGNVTQETKPTPSEAPPPPAKGPRPSLFKPLMFTAGGSQDMTYWHDWWDQLSGFQQQLILLVSMVDDFWSSLTEGQKTVTGIIAVNAVVLCCWRIPSMQRTMIKYFMSNPASKTRYLPMVLSSFSHYSIVHMVANMYVLWTFASGIVSLLGKEQFLAVYLSAGVISTMVSYMCKTATGRLHPSLGASGAVMAVLAAVCAKMPEAKLGILFLPMITFTAGNALKALVAIDTAGLILGWRLFDHAAHLGGALFGVSSQTPAT